MYVNSVLVQSAVVARRQINNAHDLGIGTVTQWTNAYAMLGARVAKLDGEELALYREYIAATA